MVSDGHVQKISLSLGCKLNICTGRGIFYSVFDEDSQHLTNRNGIGENHARIVSVELEVMLREYHFSLFRYALHDFIHADFFLI